MQRTSAGVIRLRYVGDDADRLDATLSDDGGLAVTAEPALSATVGAVADDRVDCLICEGDGSMTDWEQVLATVRRVDPTLPVVLFTGGDDDLAARAIEAGVTDVVRDDLDGVSGPVLANRVRTAVETASWSAPEPAKTERRRFETLLNTVGDGIYMFDPEGRFVMLNDRVVEMTGYDRDRLLGSHVSMILDGTDVERGEQLIKSLLSSDAESVGTLEIDIETAEGDVFPCENRISVVTDGGKFMGTVGVVRDVSERRARERALRESKERYRSLTEDVLDTSAVGTIIIDADGEVVWVNRAMVDYFGIDRESFVGRDKRTLVHERIKHIFESSDPFAERVLGALSANAAIEEFECHVLPDGDREERWLRHWSKPIEAGLYSGGRIEHYEDITDLKQRERKLERQRDELTTLHRINEEIRDIDRALVSATTRKEIETTVCRRLAGSDYYAGASVVEFTRADEPTVRAFDGFERDYLDAVIDAGDETIANTPAAQAMRTGEVEIVQDIAGDETAEGWRKPALEHGFESLAAVPVMYEDTVYSTLIVYAPRSHAFDARERTVLSELGQTIGHAIAAVEHKEREVILMALHRATRRMIHAETAEEICERAVEVTTDVLDIPEVGVFLFDESENVLEPAAYSTDVVEYYGEYPRLGPQSDSSITWNAFVSGETRVYDDISDVEDRYPGAEKAKSGLFIPLDDHGVFVAGSPAVGVFDECTTNLVDLLAATTEAALDRVAHASELRERDERLREQNRRLENLNRVNEIIRDVDQSIIASTSREGIEQAACDRLTETDRFRFAWIGTVDQHESVVQPRTWAGADDGYLDAVSFDLYDGRGEPTGLTATTRSPNAVENVAANIQTESWRQEALAREFQSMIAVPLEYDGMLYGVLSVYSGSRNACNEMVRSVLTELGETIAYAINASETKRGLLTDRVVELDLRISDSDDLLQRLADDCGATVEFRDVHDRSETTSEVLFLVRCADPATVVDVTDAMITVEEITHLSETADGHRFAATVTGQHLPLMLAEYGAAIDDIVADGTEIRAVVDLPHDADVHAFVNRVRKRYPETRLAGRSDHERSARRHGEFRAELESSLTDRQQEVLRTAYLNDYFESPRGRTGEEIADSLGISQPTLNYHLRAAEGKTFELLFGDQ